VKSTNENKIAMATINFPIKPDKTTMSADFDVPYGEIYRVRLHRVINGKNEYSCEVLTEGVPDDIREFIIRHVVSDANKHGVFQ